VERREVEAGGGEAPLGRTARAVGGRLQDEGPAARRAERPRDRRARRAERTRDVGVEPERTGELDPFGGLGDQREEERAQLRDGLRRVGDVDGDPPRLDPPGGEAGERNCADAPFRRPLPR
jgi:hypothetical protein